MATRDMKGTAAFQRAFTLIELMIVVAILGITASIAYSSYENSVRGTRRAEAQADLMELAQIQERRFSASNTYLVGGAPPDLPFEQSPRSGTPRYTIIINTPDAGTFTLIATPVGSQAADTCGVLTLNQLGIKTPNGARCW